MTRSVEPLLEYTSLDDSHSNDVVRPGTRELAIGARDGYRLAATLYAAGASGDTSVLINSATAVPRGFYRRFAEFLQRHGWHVLSYDYRGIGGSKPPKLRGFDADLRDWAFLDMTAAVDWVERELAPRRLFVVGHSFGGQVAGMLANAGAIDAMVGVSAQSGYWGVQGGRERLRVRLVATVLMPVLARAFGYFPWSVVARGEDLPKGVALEWARWCRCPNYLLDDGSLPLERYRRFAAPVLAYSIEDDDWGTRRAVDDMMRAYQNVERRHVVPGEYGLPRLGHMGWFREGAEALWREAVEWLERRAL